MNIDDFLKTYLTDDQRQNLNKLTNEAQEKIESLGAQILSEAEKQSNSLQNWLETDGTILFNEFKSKISEIYNKYSSSQIDLSDEANKIFDDIYSDDDKQSLESSIKDAEATLNSTENYTSKTSHLEELEKLDPISDDFIQTAQDFLDGKSKKVNVVKDKNNTSSQDDEHHSTHGFEDLDGDGNDIIDDAIIDLD